MNFVRNYHVYDKKNYNVDVFSRITFVYFVVLINLLDIWVYDYSRNHIRFYLGSHYFIFNDNNVDQNYYYHSNLLVYLEVYPVYLNLEVFLYWFVRLFLLVV